jgi:pimeloyl-ACP methyl ester carboxylesterase
VIVHGMQSAAPDWAAVADSLATTCRTTVLNRRGREPSGPIGASYGLPVEVADLHAVLDVAGPGATVVGHSYGGTIALLTALERQDIRSLVLYEPAFPLDGPLGGAMLDALGAAVASGDLDEALTTTMTAIMGMPAEAVEQVRGTPLWPVLRALTPATYAEFVALDGVSPSLEPFGTLDVPVTILLGELSAGTPFALIADALAKVIPDATLTRLPGQHHLAHQFAPQALAAEIAAAARRAG